MKMTAKINGRWYGLDLADGVEIEIPEGLVEKAKASGLFVKAKRRGQDKA